MFVCSTTTFSAGASSDEDAPGASPAKMIPAAVARSRKKFIYPGPSILDRSTRSGSAKTSRISAAIARGAFFNSLARCRAAGAARSPSSRRGGISMTGSCSTP
jgi:hypothetical protein